MRNALVAVVLAAAAIGCTDEAPTPPPPADRTEMPAGVASGTAPLTVAEALDREGAVTVRGGLIERDGVLRICDFTYDSYPPRCAEPLLEVEGMDIREHPTEEVAGVRWTSGPVTLTGQVRDGILTVETVEEG